MLFFLLLLLLTIGPSGSLTTVRSGAAASGDDKPRQVVIRTFDRVTIEISKEYVTSKGMPFPSTIKSVTNLKAFLAKIYPDKGHELRQAVLNLLRCRDLADADTPLGDYLKEGLDRFAVDLNGKPLVYDREKIEEIIAETTGGLRTQLQQKSGVKKGERLGAGERPIVVAVPATSFLTRYASSLTITLLATNFVSLLALILLWVNRKPEASEGSPLEHNAETKITRAPVKHFKKPEDDAAPGSDPVITVQAPITSQIGAQSDSDCNESTADICAGEGDDEKWLVVGTSVPGKLHTESNPPIPCQDRCFYRGLGDGWGVAVVCDGAGSKKLSHHGAQYVAQKAGQYFQDYITQSRLQADGLLPSDNVWHKDARAVFINIKYELDRMAREKFDVNSNLLSCTVIVLIHTPRGVMTSHVGDGRAAFCNADQEWKAVMKPHKGEEANETVFITALEPDKPNCYVESTVVRETPVAFTVMSDGCESHAFEINIRDEKEERYSDPNRPYPRFFQPLVSTLKRLHESDTPKTEIDRRWRKFIESGTERLKTESDDKTMILGVLLN